jgi:hypothetical protein
MSIFKKSLPSGKRIFSALRSDSRAKKTAGSAAASGERLDFFVSVEE